ncbi:MAG: hypothetical protein AB7J13_06670 [Pyrinomonadaceae bacterium]
MMIAASFVYPQEYRYPNRDLRNLCLEDVRTRAQSTESAFAELSLSRDIPIGLEISPNDTEFHEYSIEFKNGSLTELMAALVSQNNLYTWEIANGVVHVYPSDRYRDTQLKDLLETNVSKFEVKKGTSSWSLVSALISAPEIQKALVTNTLSYRPRSFSGGYIPQLGKDFRSDGSNLALSSILNKVIKESPTAKFWVIKKHVNNPLEFSISISAKHEELPANTLNFPDREY